MNRCMPIPDTSKPVLADAHFADPKLFVYREDLLDSQIVGKNFSYCLHLCHGCY